jgi:hypothetical protein
MAGHVIADDGHQVQLLRSRERRAVQCLCLLFSMPERGRAGPAGIGVLQDAHSPGMAQVSAPDLPGDQRQRVAPAGGQLARHQGLGEQRVVQQIEQLILGLDVAVQAHRARAERGCDPAHGDGIEALGVGDAERSRGDLLPAEPGLTHAGFRSGPDPVPAVCSGHPASLT